MTHENKFGLFIHWGIYSQLKLHEQALARYDMENEEYEKLQQTFNPTLYDPEEWVLLAKKAGMKYICFTTKHHDGFCMWDTKYTDYNIMNTPYGKDVLKMLADACAKHGMLLSLYYSNPDWHHEYGYNPASSHQWKAKYKATINTETYREYVKNQIVELLTNYGPIYTFFWDIPPKIEDSSLNELIRKLQPGIFINDRGWDSGDFSTPERDFQKIDGGRFTRMTEACNSVGEQSWGYREGEDFYTKRYLCTSIDRIMAMGGSYLLNLGPDEYGKVTDDYKSKLLQIADWYNRMEGCLERTEEDTFEYKIHKNKVIVNKKNGKTYLHFYDGIRSSSITMENIPSSPKNVKLMNNGQPLSLQKRVCPGEGQRGGKSDEYFCISNIPADDFSSEPIVIEIEW